MVCCISFVIDFTAQAFVTIPDSKESLFAIEYIISTLQNRGMNNIIIRDSNK